MARMLGIDYGKKRIGLALSDPTGVIASPLDVIENAGMQKSTRKLAELAADREIERFVVGLPLNMDGSEGPAARLVRTFAGKLGESSGLPVDLWDERLTTSAAERAMLQADLSRAKRAKRIDKLAAQAILQAYLDRHSRS